MESSDERITGVILHYLDVYGSGSHADENCDIIFHGTFSTSFSKTDVDRAGVINTRTFK